MLPLQMGRAFAWGAMFALLGGFTGGLILWLFEVCVLGNDRVSGLSDLLIVLVTSTAWGAFKAAPTTVLVFPLLYRIWPTRNLKNFGFGTRVRCPGGFCGQHVPLLISDPGIVIDKIGFLLSMDPV